MKELHRIKQRIEKENLTEVFVVGTSVKSCEVLTEILKNDVLKSLPLSYRRITNPDTSDGINYANGVVILWDRWFENNKVIDFIARNRGFMPHIFNVSDF